MSAHVRTLLTLALLALPALAQRAPDLRPDTERIDVVPGRPLVLPVEIVDDRVLRRGVFEARLDDGLPIPGRIVWIGVSQSTPGGWLGPESEWGAWTPAELERLEARPAGRWYLVCEMPPEAVGLGMWFEGERSAVNWLTDPWRYGRDAQRRVDERMWRATLPPESKSSEHVMRAVTRLLSSPWTRWRGRLMLGELEPGGPMRDGWDPAGRPGVVAHEGVLESLARYQDGLWQVAMARLWVGDPDIAIELRERLGEVGRFGAGDDRTWAPVFPPTPDRESALRRDLCSPFVGDSDIALRASAWLIGRPHATAWTLDDAGRTDASTGDPAPTLSVMLFGSAPALLSISGLEPESVDPRTEVRRVLPSTGSPAGVRAATASVRAGAFRRQVGVVRGVRPVHPPGVAIGPLVRDWTHDAWGAGLEGDGAGVPLSRATTARLFRQGRDRWRVLVRCNLPEGLARAEDSVTLWFGPRAGGPSITLHADGRTADPRTGEPTGRVQTAGVPGGWCAVVDIPADAIEAGGLLRLGLTRTPPGDERQAWPRRMLPWQPEPGRLAFDLSTWDGM
ncbi:MAG: hypothetical protein ACF8Q5_00375 [Phycisphaerales bacterium JB040]